MKDELMGAKARGGVQHGRKRRKEGTGKMKSSKRKEWNVSFGLSDNVELRDFEK